MILPRNLLPFCIKKIGKENLNWKVIASEIFSLKKSHVTKRHIAVIKIFWKKHKASANAKNIYATTANIQLLARTIQLKSTKKQNRE